MTTHDMDLECYGMNLEASEEANYDLLKDKFPTFKIHDFPTFKEHKKTQYLVMVEGGQAPKVRHKKYGEAKKEALRLAKLTGKPTELLMTLKRYETEVTETSYKHVI